MAGALEREAKDLLADHIELLAAEPYVAIERMVPHKLVREVVGVSGTKFAIETFANPLARGEIQVVAEIYALLDDKWTKPLADGYVVHTRAGVVERGSQSHPS